MNCCEYGQIFSLVYTEIISTLITTCTFIINSLLKLQIYEYIIVNTRRIKWYKLCQGTLFFL